MTTGDDHHDGRSQDEVLAGEYVLGVLPIHIRRDVERRMREDQAFAALVTRWQTNLGSFNDDYEDVAPPASVLASVERRLFGTTSESQATSSIWQTLAFWRWTSAITSLVAIAAVAYAFYATGIDRPASQALVAELSSPNTQLSLLASYNPSNGHMRVVPVAAREADRKSLQLWLVPAAGDPRSLGILQADGNGDVIVPKQIRDNLNEGSTIAISLEPFGGSPTGKPTGPVLASGGAKWMR